MRPKALAPGLALVAVVAALEGCSGTPTLLRAGGENGLLGAFRSSDRGTDRTQTEGTGGLSNLGKALGLNNGASGRLITPKWCGLSLTTLARPIKDPILNDIIWGSADEQAVDPVSRRALEANGLRVGLITGDLPAEVQALIDAPPPNRVEPVAYSQPEGTPNLIQANTKPVDEVSLLVSRDGRAGGKNYEQAGGWFRVVAAHEGDKAVSLRIVPEVHHGPIRRRARNTDANAAAPGNFAPLEISMQDGQEEETFRDLSASVSVRPDQYVVIGCRPELKHSLGHFLLTEPDSGSDRLQQKLVLIRVGRNSAPDSAGGDAADGMRPIDPLADTPPRKRRAVGGRP